MESCTLSHNPYNFYFFLIFIVPSHVPPLTFRQKWKLGGHDSVFYGNPLKLII